MKRILFLLAVLCLGSVFLSSPALAIPSLQLDVSDGAYDWSTESIVTAATIFDLSAFLIPDKKATLGLDYFISAALVPKTPVSPSFGSFKIGNVTYSQTEGKMSYGTPPSFGTDDLGHTGEYFPTAYAEIRFQFDETSYRSAYDTQEKYTVDPRPSPKPDIKMYYEVFQVDTTGLAAGYEIHFDLYGLGADGKLQVAPYSHDAETVPEPATMLLLGAGLIGLAAFGRKRFLRE